MPDRTRLLLLLHAVSAAAGIVIGVHWWPGPWFVVVAVLYVVAQAVPMPTPSRHGVSMAPLVAAAVALSTGSPVLVLATGAVSIPAAYLVVHISFGRRVVDTRFPAEPVGVGVFAGLFHAGSLLLGGRSATDPLALSLFAVAAVAGYFTTAGVRAAVAAQGRSVPRRLIFLGSLRDWRAFATLYVSAALYATTVPVVGWWAIPLAGLPYGFGHLSLHRLQVTRTTYDQTIRALGSIPEAGGLVAPGRGERTADLAVAVASELGLGVPALERVEYAALLHDIGRLVLANPAVAAGGYTPTDISGWSAAIIGEAKHLDEVAEVVGVIHQPYRRPGQERDTTLPREAQVVKVVTAYDDGVAAAGDPLEAIEVLHRGAAYEFDPEVVMALRRVLERRGTIAA